MGRRKGSVRVRAVVRSLEMAALRMECGSVAREAWLDDSPGELETGR